jgi:hypothetical protein
MRAARDVLYAWPEHGWTAADVFFIILTEHVISWIAF